MLNSFFQVFLFIIATTVLRILNNKILVYLFAPLVILNVVHQCLAEHPTHYLVQSGVEVTPCVLSLCGSTETALKREAVHQIEVPPHYHSRTGLLRFVYNEGAVFIAEIDIIL